MAGPPHRQRLSCAEYGKRGAMSSARRRPCPLPAGEPAPYPIRHPGTLPHHCRSQEGRPSPSGFPQARPLAAASSHPGTGTPPPDAKACRPSLPALLRASSCAAPPAPERPASGDGRHTPPADAPPARPLRAPALYWQGVRAVCGRSLPFPTREVFHGRPAMHPHPPFLPLL